MEDLPVLDFMVKSGFRNYNVEFCNLEFSNMATDGTHFIVDSKVQQIYNLNYNNMIVLNAHEHQKSYQAAEVTIDNLLRMNMRRDSHLVAIGGGIIQDVACWVASTYMRGIPWSFVPTTLLAQTDSCIGSKSSINFNQHKNLLGTFYPPQAVYIDDKFRATLSDDDINSGLAELIKLMIIDDRSVEKLEYIVAHRPVKDASIAEALQIKKYFIEIDEFDKGSRNLLNYGHCFGHAIETASDYVIPHGIAVAMGMDLANALNNTEWYNRYHGILKSLYSNYLNIELDLDQVFAAMNKDKKNIGGKLTIIVPDQFGLTKKQFVNDDDFKKKCRTLFDKIKE
jgi:3-dehydroquinate synthase